MHRSALVALALASCGFNSSGVQGPGGSTAASSASSTATSGDTSSTSEDSTTMLSLGSSSSASPDTSSTGVVDADDCNGMPMPMLPTSAGPVSEISVLDVRFSGSASNLAHVQPGDTIVLEFGYEVASCECTDCVTQGMLGFIDADWRACFFNDTPGCAGATGTAMIAVEAPLQPGFHPIAFWRTWEFACNPEAGGLDPENAIAGLCVGAL